MTAVRVEVSGEVHTVVLSRPAAKNAIDRSTAQVLADTFRAFDADPSAKVAVLWGEGGDFCAGADLKAIAAGDANRIDETGDGPLGPTRLLLNKPVIAAVEGHAVAGGLELALWCDLRVAAKSAVFGVYCRRFGVPLIDGGTVRLPRLIGLSHAMDMILTGRAVSAQEALSMGLANRVVEDGSAKEAAQALAQLLCRFPQACLRADRRSALTGHALPLDEALREELVRGREVLASESFPGAARFAAGVGRHGDLSE